MKKSSLDNLKWMGQESVKKFNRNQKFMLEEKEKNENKENYLQFKEQSEIAAVEINLICQVAELCFNVAYDEFRKRIEVKK